MYKTKIKVRNSKDGESKPFLVSTICQYYVNTFHMALHSVLTFNIQWEKKLNVSKTGKPWINSFLGYMFIHVDYISQSPLQEWFSKWVLTDRSYMCHFQPWPIKALCEPSFFIFSMSHPGVICWRGPIPFGLIPWITERSKVSLLWAWMRNKILLC